MTTPVDTLDQHLEDADVNSLIPHPDNPRRGDLDAIEESILANGWYGAVIVQRSTRHILAGNHRWQGAKNAGALTVPTIFIEVDDATARRIVLADNRTSDVADYDQSELARILNQIKLESGSVTGTGYTNADVDQMLESLRLVQAEATESTGRKTRPAPKDGRFTIGPHKIQIDPDKLGEWWDSLTQAVGTDEADIVAECRRRLKL